MTLPVMWVEPIGGEKRVLQALEDGEVADYSGCDPADRRVRAAFLNAVLSGREPEGGDRRPAFRGSLQVRGGHVEGGLRTPMGEGVGTSGRASLAFLECRFDAPVDLSGAGLLSLSLVDCELPMLVAASLELKADLDLSGSRFTGPRAEDPDPGDVKGCAVYLDGAQIGGRLLMRARGRRRFEAAGTVRLEGARIEGDLVADGAELDGRGERALDARGALIGGDARFFPHAGRSFEAWGEVSFSAASIRGDLRLPAARLANPGGRALHCEDLKVETVTLTSQGGVPFRAAGRLNFLSATIGGNWVLAGARLAPGPDYEGRTARGGPVAANLQQMRVSNALMLSDVGVLDPSEPEPTLSGTRRPVAGWFLLNAGRIGSILDDEDGWPEAGFLDLDGLRYERIGDTGEDPSARRVRWLHLQYVGGKPSAASFRPQPFEELARVLRQHGRGPEADVIAVEKVRTRLAARVDRPWSRVLPRILMLVSLHGHSSARALASFALLVALGTCLYASALFGFDQPFVPVELDPERTEYTAAFGWLRATHTEGCRALALPFFALDGALPLVDVGQTSSCRFAPHGPGRNLWLLLHSAYTLAGAVLSAVVVLTLSGLLRRD